MTELNKGRNRENGATPDTTHAHDHTAIDLFALARMSDEKFAENLSNLAATSNVTPESLIKERTAILLAAAPHQNDELSNVAEDQAMQPRSSGSRCVSLEILLAMNLPPARSILSPWLNVGSLSMLYAWRGIGKSWLGLGIGYAVASNSEILGWKAQGKWRVLYIDGELPAATLQKRLAMMVKSHNEDALADGFMVITPDLQNNGVMPNLSTTEGQAEIDVYADQADLIIVDNIATLCRSGKENEGESWLPVQSWALRHRAQGRAVLFIHHSGKNGQQRGASRREDVLDTVIALRRPDDYRPEEGARFELLFEKARNLAGDEAAPIEANLFTDGDVIRWEWKRGSDSLISRIIELIDDGATRNEICQLTGLDRFQLKRTVDKANQERVSPIKLPDGRSKVSK